MTAPVLRFGRSIRILLPAAILALVAGLLALVALLHWNGTLGPLFSLVMVVAVLAGWMLHRGVARAQQERAGQQRLLDALLEHLPLGVVAVSRDDGRVRFVNPYGRELFGLPFETGSDLLAQLSTLRWFLPDGSPMHAESVTIPATRQTGQPAQPLQALVERLDGERIPVVLRSFPLSVDGDRDFDTVLGIAQDRRDIESVFAELGRSQRELQALLDSVTVGVVMVTRPERRVLFSNPCFQALTGVRPEIGAPLRNELWRLERADGSLIPVEAGSIAGVMLTGRAVTLEDPVLVTADGRRIPVAITSAPVRRTGGPDFDAVVTIIQDRSEIERAVSNLREWESRFDRVTRMTGQAVYEWDLPGDWCRFSGALESVLGWKAAEVSSDAKWRSLVHPEDLQAAQAEYAGSSREGRLFEAVYRLRHADGRWLWIRDRGEHLYDPAGEPVGMVGTIADITLQREIEAQLRQSQKMETIGTMAGGIAHDFNNHLTAVIGHLTLIEEQRIPASAHNEQIRRARRAAERCAELTRGLLSFSRMQPANPRPVFLNSIAEETSGLLQHVLPASIALHLDLDPSAPMALADPVQIEQVLLNLCTNARDAMDDSGTLRIATRRTTRARGPGEDIPGAIEWIEIEVSDTGTGIAPEVLPRIFEPFFSTKPVGQGAGLGLTMVDGIVSRHRGRVEVESKAGHGSRFRILLPVYVPNEDGGPAEITHAETEADIRGCTVLVVDDEPGVREYAAGVLRSAGANVVCAAHGDEALERLAEDPTHIQVVLMDLTMPGTPVRLVVEGMRRLAPGLPIVLTSGFAGDSGAREDINHLPFLQKPYLPRHLLRLIGQVRGGSPAVSAGR